MKEKKSKLKYTVAKRKNCAVRWVFEKRIRET